MKAQSPHSADSNRISGSNTSQRSKRGRRAAGPVDAPAKLTRTSVADSPRRRARLKQYLEANLDEQTASDLGKALHAPSLTAPEFEFSYLKERGEQKQKPSPLVQQWLEKTGLESLDELRELLGQAAVQARSEEEKQRSVPTEDLNNTNIKIGETTQKNTSPKETALDTETLPIAVKRETIQSGFERHEVPQSSLNRADRLSHDSKDTPISPPLTKKRSSRKRLASSQTPSRRANRKRNRSIQGTQAIRHRKLRFSLVLTTCFMILIAGISMIIHYSKYSNPNPEDNSQLHVLGSVGTEPIVSLDEPLPLSEKQYKELVRGSGVVVEENHNVVLRVFVFSGQDGHLIGSASDAGIVAGKLTPQKTGSLIFNAVKGRTEGSRILITHAVRQGGHSVMEIGVVDILYTQARGEVQELPANFPINIFTTDARPTPEYRSEFPGDLMVAPLIKGSGAKVEQGQNLLVNYLEYSYSNPPVLLQDRWDTGGAKIMLGESVQAGIAQGLVDQSIGSRVVMLIPPDEGTGTSATIVIADILTAWDPTDTKPTSKTDKTEQNK